MIKLEHVTPKPESIPANILRTGDTFVLPGGTSTFVVTDDSGPLSIHSVCLDTGFRHVMYEPTKCRVFLVDVEAKVTPRFGDIVFDLNRRDAQKPTRSERDHV